MKLLREPLMLAALAAAIFFGWNAVAEAGEPRIAIKGYDPVAYFTDERPIVGDPQYQYEWDGGSTDLHLPNISRCSRPIPIAICRSTTTGAPRQCRKERRYTGIRNGGSWSTAAFTCSEGRSVPV